MAGPFDEARNSVLVADGRVLWHIRVWLRKVYLPAEFGDEIILRLQDGVLRILTLHQAIEYAQELLRPYMPEGRSLSEELIEERSQEN
jgi:hypothetical protein